MPPVSSCPEVQIPHGYFEQNSILLGYFPLNRDLPVEEEMLRRGRGFGVTQPRDSGWTAWPVSQSLQGR